MTSLQARVAKGAAAETVTAIEDRVRNGATFLDLYVVGWAERIDTNLLDLGSCQRCLLGQLFGEYNAGLKSLGIDCWHGLTLGFDAPDIFSEQEPPALTAAWRDLILSRRPSVAAPDQHGRGR